MPREMCVGNWTGEEWEAAQDGEDENEEEENCPSPPPRRRNHFIDDERGVVK